MLKKGRGKTCSGLAETSDTSLEPKWKSRQVLGITKHKVIIKPNILLPLYQKSTKTSPDLPKDGSTTDLKIKPDTTYVIMNNQNPALGFGCQFRHASISVLGLAKNFNYFKNGEAHQIRVQFEKIRPKHRTNISQVLWVQKSCVLIKHNMLFPLHVSTIFKTGRRTLHIIVQPTITHPAGQTSHYKHFILISSTHPPHPPAFSIGTLLRLCTAQKCLNNIQANLTP